MRLSLRRHFWVVNAITVAVCAVYGAQIVNELIAAHALADSAKVRPLPPIATLAPAAIVTRPSKDSAALVARNPFCSACVPGEPASPPTAELVAAGDGPPITSLPLELIATHVTLDAEDSFATVRNTTRRTSGAYGVTDRIPGGGPVVAVSVRHIDFENREVTPPRVERLPLGARPPPARAGRARAAGERGPRTPRDALTAELDEGIRKLADTRYEVDRDLINRMLRDPRVIGGVRVRPAFSEGKAEGFQLSGVHRDSPADRIGLRNGDRVVAVNGFELSSPDKVLEIYSKVSTASNIDVSVVRNGQPVTISYSIR